MPLTGRHQGGRKGSFGQPERHQGGRKGLIGQLARHQGGRKGSIGQLARHQRGTSFFFARVRALCVPRGTSHLHQGGTREAGKNHLHRLGGTSTTSMANGPVRGKSRGGPYHGRLAVGCPQHRLASNRPLGAPVAQNCLSTTACSTESSLKGLRSASYASTP